MNIRKATIEDQEHIWNILRPVLRAGETYTLPTDMSRTAAIKYWCGTDKQTYVAEGDGVILGTYYIRDNQAGGGDHICNCGYVTAPEARGKGIAGTMCEHSQAEARKLGYRGMQYNCVVASNVGAVRLWQKFGFGILGTIPGAFNHPNFGYVDAHIMFKAL